MDYSIRSNKFRCGKLTLSIALCFGLAMKSDRIHAASDGIILVPGWYRGGGYDLSALYYHQDSGALSFWGINGGHSERFSPSTYAELEMGGHAWFLISMVFGLGTYRMDQQSGLQSTLSLQWWSPFLLGYARFRENITHWEDQNLKGVEYGLIWKFPIPVCDYVDGEWNWGMEGVTYDSPNRR